MKKSLLFVLLLFTTVIGFGQCPDSNITLSSQSDIDNFSVDYPNCTELLRTLEITNNTGITNLLGLSQITMIGPDLAVGENLTVFAPNLTSLAGLESLEMINGDFRITGTDIVDFSGLDNLTLIRRSLSMSNNDVFESFNGAISLQEIGRLAISDHPVQESLLGLESLNTVTGTVQITEMPALTSFNGLNNLQKIGKLVMNLNPVFENLNALSNVTSLGQLVLVDNVLINDISGLSNVEPSSLFVQIVIRDNPNLSMCNIQMVCDNLNSGLPLEFSINATGCNSIPEVEFSCALANQDVSLNSTIMVYPNPVSENLIISASHLVDFKKATVYSTLGEYLFETTSTMLDFSAFNTGVYFITIETFQGTITKKIFKE